MNRQNALLGEDKSLFQLQHCVLNSGNSDAPEKRGLEAIALCSFLSLSSGAERDTSADHRVLF